MWNLCCISQWVFFVLFFTLAVTVTLGFFVVISINFFINSSETKPPRQKNYISVSKYCITTTKKYKLLGVGGG